MRDPRIDPAPGDMLFKARAGIRRTVLRIEHTPGYASTVTFMQSGLSHEKRITVRSWRRWAASTNVDARGA